MQCLIEWLDCDCDVTDYPPVTIYRGTVSVDAGFAGKPTAISPAMQNGVGVNVRS